MRTERCSRPRCFDAFPDLIVHAAKRVDGHPEEIREPLNHVEPACPAKAVA
jgi:hypothetical protein